MQAEPLVLPPVCCYTGRVAAWAPFPQPAAAAVASAGGLPPLKTSSPGVWLRSDAGGVLAVQWRPDAPPLLTCTLRSSQQLVRAPLWRGGFAFRLLCPAHSAPAAAAGGSSGHVLFLSLPQPPAIGHSSGGGMAQPTGQQPRTATIAVHFDTPQAGRECGALLQAIHQGSLTVVAAPGQPARPVAKPAAPAVEGKTAPAADRAVAGGAAAGGIGATAGGQGEASAAAAEEWDELFGYADEAALDAAIQASARVLSLKESLAALLASDASPGSLQMSLRHPWLLDSLLQAAQADPLFLELAARWEQAVERVESLLDKTHRQS